MSWPKVPLSDIILELESGSRPKGGVRGGENGVPSLGGEHLNDIGDIETRNEKRVPESFFQRMRSGVVRRNDLLIVKDGATTGKIAFVGDRFPYDQAGVNEHVFRVALDPKLAEPAYVFRFLHSRAGQREIMKDFRGSTIGGIGRTFVDKALIPLPPLNDQKRLAGILNQADALCRQSQRQAGRFKGLRSSIFVSLFVQDAIQSQQVALGEITTKITDGTHKTPKYQEEGVPFLSAKDIKNDNLLWGACRFISEEEHRQLNRRCNPEEGDIVMSKSGALGSVAVFHDYGPCSFFESLALIKPNRELVLSRYLAEFLRTPIAQRQLSKAIKGVAVRHLHLADIKEVRLPLPSMGAQMHFVERIEAVEGQRRVAEAQHQRLQGLFSALQQRAFRGEL